jgi:16S rRNA processing protein RimM
MGIDAVPQRLEVGRVGRANGLKGEVNVVLTTDRAERAEPGAVLYADDEELVVASARRQGQRLIMRFEGVDDRDAAGALTGAVLTADALDDEGVLWVHELVGAEVVDTRGASLGSVESVQANPAHDLLVLDGGALVPVVFVVEHEAGRVVVDPPPGLLDV